MEIAAAFRGDRALSVCARGGTEIPVVIWCRALFTLFCICLIKVGARFGVSRIRGGRVFGNSILHRRAFLAGSEARCRSGSPSADPRPLFVEQCGAV